MFTPACQFSSLSLLSAILMLSSVHSRYSDNLFMQTCHLAAQNLNETDCWVCGHMPSHQGSDFALQAVPANISELLTDHLNNDTFSGEESILEVNYQASFPACFRWPARPNATELGTTTRCRNTITRSLDDPPTVSGLLPSTFTVPLNSPPPLNSSSTRPRKYRLLIASCRVWRDPFAVCPPGGRWVAPEDIFWICGSKAYKQLPEVWSGSCALGRVVPAIRVTKERPVGRIRNTRELSQSQDIVNTYMPLTDLDLYGSAVVFPQIGVIRVGWAVYRLQAVLELLSNETSESLQSLAYEQRELRTLALQNRMALDMILASHGGVCALVGSECCVYVPDASEEIFDHARHIAHLGALQKDASHAWLQAVTEWFGTWWGSIFKYILLAIGLLVGLLLSFKLLYCLLVRTCCPSSPTHLMLQFPSASEEDLALDLEMEEIAGLCAIEIN